MEAIKTFVQAYINKDLPYNTISDSVALQLILSGFKVVDGAEVNIFNTSKQNLLYVNSLYRVIIDKRDKDSLSSYIVYYWDYLSESGWFLVNVSLNYLLEMVQHPDFGTDLWPLLFQSETYKGRYSIFRDKVAEYLY